jgi:hypothetical protein
VANGWYNAGLDAIAKGSVAWKASGGATIKAVLVDAASYTVSLTTHANLSDIPVGMRVATSATMTLVDATGGGVLDASDVTFSAVTGAVSEAVVLYLDTGNASTSTLLLYIDTATGLPVTPNGGDITVQWDNGANKVAKI